MFQHQFYPEYHRNMRALLLMALLIISTLAGSPRPPPGGTSIQSQHHHEPTQEIIRHARKKKLKMGKGRKKMRQGTARRYIEKQYLVQNRTVALLGNDVQRILHSTKGLVQPPGMSHHSTPNITGYLLERKNPHVYKNGLTKLLNTVNNRGESIDETPHKKPDSKDNYDFDITLLKDDAQANLSNALVHIIASIENFTVNHTENTPCGQLAECNAELQKVFLGLLPSCPCSYPSGIFYDNKIWDETHQKFFRWKDASSERLDVYKSGAEYCIRSQIAHRSATLSAQHCCYDRKRKLITRGSGAGNPNYISPDVSAVLHDRIDILPWRLCKGDFTKFNKVRPPDNGNSCDENPHEKEFNKQIKITVSY